MAGVRLSSIITGVTADMVASGFTAVPVTLGQLGKTARSMAHKGFAIGDAYTERADDRRGQLGVSRLTLAILYQLTGDAQVSTYADALDLTEDAQAALDRKWTGGYHTRPLSIRLTELVIEGSWVRADILLRLDHIIYTP